jgi:hypothetical protein
MTADAFGEFERGGWERAAPRYEECCPISGRVRWALVNAPYRQASGYARNVS